MTTQHELLPGLPVSGATALPFGAGEWAGAWTGHAEGFVVQFHPNTGVAWTGNFQPGADGWQGVIEHPDGKHLIIVARGQGYVVDPETHCVVSRFPGSLQHVVPLQHLDAIVLSDGLGFEAIKRDSTWWRSRRVSWDEIRNIEIEGTVMRGEASSPAPDGNQWFPFTVDLMTGDATDNIFEQQIRWAPVKPGEGAE